MDMITGTYYKINHLFISISRGVAGNSLSYLLNTGGLLGYYFLYNGNIEKTSIEME